VTTRSQLQRACAELPGAELDHPFGDDIDVYKVGGKLFALVPLENAPATINLKCDPDEGVALRQEYGAIVPGYHMNKRHWITVTLDGTVPHPLVLDLIENSYGLIVASLPKRLRPQED